MVENKKGIVVTREYLEQLRGDLAETKKKLAWVCQEWKDQVHRDGVIQMDLRRELNEAQLIIKNLTK